MRRLHERVEKLEAQTSAARIGLPTIAVRRGESLESAATTWKKTRGLAPDQPLPRGVRFICIPAKRPAGETAK